MDMWWWYGGWCMGEVVDDFFFLIRKHLAFGVWSGFLRVLLVE